jgi:hypothetical protein
LITVLNLLLENCWGWWVTFRISSTRHNIRSFHTYVYI